MSIAEEKTNLEHFNFYLREFVTQLIQVSPKSKESLEESYKELLTNQNYKDDKFIKLFMKKAYPGANMIREKNGELFGKQPDLIEGLNFSDLWSHPKLTENSKKSIWKYLTLLYIYGRTVVSAPTKIEKMIKDFETFGDTEAPTDANAQMLQQMLNNLKEKNELGEDSDEEKDSKGSGMPFNFNIESLLGGNSFIKGLMSDIKDEFKDMELPENPTDIGSVFKSLQNPATQAKMQNIMGKMAKHFENGNMGDLNNLQTQAQQMMQSMGINPDQLAQQAEAMGLNQGQVNKIKTANRNESARQRLLRKLQEKQKNKEESGEQ
jgi:hypothetical protein